ncbi:MAG: hypothetical protein KGM16_03175 [Bacteroidota bacterium]|nr:hypothetical protein [Bacteroidota bacterium]
MTYQLPGYYPALPANLNKINAVDNNFSLLFKYHIDTQSPLKVAVTVQEVVLI